MHCNDIDDEIGMRSTAAHEDQFVLLTIGRETYGIEIGAIHGIIMPQALTQIPRTRPYVNGVTNLRGTILPVIDMRTRFGLDPIPAESAKHVRFVVVETATVTAGLIVDAVSEVAGLSQDRIEPPCNLVASQETDCISGVGKLTDGKHDRLVMILDVDRLLETDAVNLPKAA